jgi:hypothetical protein
MRQIGHVEYNAARISRSAKLKAFSTWPENFFGDLDQVNSNNVFMRELQLQVEQICGMLALHSLQLICSLFFRARMINSAQAAAGSAPPAPQHAATKLANRSGVNACKVSSSAAKTMKSPPTTNGRDHPAQKIQLIPK